MRPGLSEDLQAINDARKTAVIDRELHRLNIDMAALQETRLPENGSLKEEHYTFFWQGKSADEPREQGVGFAVRNSLLQIIEPPTDGTERILKLRLSTVEGHVNIICVYAPTLLATVETKDHFYESLDTALSTIPASEHIYVIGDFNARVYSDREAWPNVVGHHGTGKMNDNGQRLLELCCYHNLCITNTFFQNKACHKVSWRHPRSKHWHQLDLVVTRRDSINSVCKTRAYHSADCDTDHSLIASKVKLKPKKLHHTKPVKKCAPLKSKTGEVITDEDKQMTRWVEHYLELYSRENMVSQEALDALEDLPVLEELDAEPTLEELSKAIDALSCGLSG
ncbi:craniofacial development protein 2-like [Montipora foliosa]|uniref:craniofacial development protein 2-like n=1 Tax=Montipora foliosa TaxID=591990 RepID=UPI0035F181CA